MIRININETNFKFKGILSPRNRTEYIVLHHRAGDGNVESIHNQHLNNGYSGIGYHFYIRKDGSVFRGRPINTIGAHCLNYNYNSVGVCFEGNFENEEMSVLQLNAGVEIVNYLKSLYPNAAIVGHKELINTACPGENFPIDKIKKRKVVELMSVEEAKKIIQTKAGIENETLKFLLCYKYGEELIVKLAKAMV